MKRRPAIPRRTDTSVRSRASHFVGSIGVPPVRTGGTPMPPGAAYSTIHYERLTEPATEAAGEQAPHFRAGS
ncbi:hypothetical protein RAS1_29560 [Phycisphaerae bacterium RAS1]|nr:hypothetical protein RAS1_29560 [Phycisphaerae bacterium RAS1]